MAQSYKGQNAIDRLASEWALHDGTIRRVEIEATQNGEVRLQLECTPRSESAVMTTWIRFAGVTRFDLAWYNETDFLLVAGYKAQVQSSGLVYVSLDPFDDRTSTPDERDCCVIEARGIEVEFAMKSEALA